MEVRGEKEILLFVFQETINNNNAKGAESHQEKENSTQDQRQDEGWQQEAAGSWTGDIIVWDTSRDTEDRETLYKSRIQGGSIRSLKFDMLSLLQFLRFLFNVSFTFTSF